MENIPITRQNKYPGTMSANNFTTHFHPFSTLPEVVSHVHPKFVIMATAEAVTSQRIDTIHALLHQFPILGMIIQLSSSWTSIVPDHAKEDQSYLPPHDPSPSNDGDDKGNRGNDKDHDDYQDSKTTQGGHSNLKRRRLEPPLLHSAENPAQKDDDIKDTTMEMGQYNGHGKQHQGKQHCSAVMAMAEPKSSSQYGGVEQRF